jgi:2-methylisocitrate lyase-like PEP mutase family enzyme
MTAAKKLRALLMDGDELLLAPGVFDGMSARLVEQAGFSIVYASGGAIARSQGIPDLNLMTASEVTHELEIIAEAVDVPVIADADTGHGSPLNVFRTVNRFRRGGIGGFHIEDQVFPKRCGHYDDKRVVEAAEMVQRLRAARDAAGDMVVIARTDALALEPLSKVIDRAHAYMEAGADVIFVEAPVSEAQIAEIAEALPYPKLINMFHGGKTPMVPADRLRELGYRIVIIPSDLQRASIAAMRETLRVIARDGDSMAMADRMVTFKEREEIVDTAGFLDRDAHYAR